MPDSYGGTDLRSILHSAFSFVRSYEMNQSAGALTLDHVIQEQITFLKKGASRDIVDNRGEAIGNRPTRYDRLETLEQMLKATIEMVRSAGDDVGALMSIGIYEASADGTGKTP